MMRSLYSGISGLRNHQTRMDVIGNNIANVNTAGYKTSRVIFQDIFSQNMAAGMANQGDIGGTNPLQVGLGIRLSTVDVIHTRSAFGRTDKETDMMINGDGYFIVAQINPDTGMFEPLYTRAGNFDIDADGYLVNSLGYYVLGYTDTLVMGVVDPGQQEYPEQLQGTIAAGDTIPIGTVIGANTLEGPLTIPANLFGPGEPAAPLTLAAGQTYPEKQMRTTAAWVYPAGSTPDPLPIPAAGPQQFRAPTFGLVTTGNPNPETDAQGLARIRVTSDAFYNVPLWRDLTAAQQASLMAMIESGDADDLPADFFDQFPMETVSLPGFGVNSIGDVSVILANRSVVIGRIAVAMFANPSGLEKAGNSLYREAASSGPALVTEALSEGAGQIDSGGLEMSNVDLATEFTDMIVTQRGFQANSRIITVSDTMLEELVNLKR